MASVNITPGYVWTSGETVTPTKLNSAAAPTATATLADGEVTNAKLASGIDGAKITNDSVSNAKLASGIDAGKLTTGTLPVARIADGAITAAKLSTGAEGTGVGFVRTASSNYIIMQGPDGTKVGYAWGVSQNSSTNSLSAVSFPISFSSAPSVTATVSGILFGFSRFVSFGTVGTTFFQFQVRDASDTAQAHPINWIAIGPMVY
jgi:hypothetical protein